MGPAVAGLQGTRRARCPRKAAQDMSVAGDSARVTVGVALPPPEAFRIFTEEIELWWRRGPRFRSAPGDSGLIALEPRLDGRVFESYTVNAREHVVEIGRIRVWEPPRRLLFDWRASNFAAAEHTEVE